MTWVGDRCRLVDIRDVEPTRQRIMRIEGARAPGSSYPDAPRAQRLIRGLCARTLNKLFRLAAQQLERQLSCPVRRNGARSHARLLRRLGKRLQRLLCRPAGFVKPAACLGGVVQALVGHGQEEPGVEHVGLVRVGVQLGGFGQPLERLLKAAGSVERCSEFVDVPMIPGRFR